MELWDVTTNPAGETYEKLIQIVCRHSDYFYFVTRKELKYDQEQLQKFTPYIIRTYKTKEWESTITCGPAATIHEVAINSETIQLLINHASE